MIWWRKTDQARRRRATSAAMVVGMLVIPTCADAQPFQHWVIPEQAPVGARQPRLHDYSPNSPANIIEQKRLSKYDRKQKRLNRKLDKSLDICRC